MIRKVRVRDCEMGVGPPNMTSIYYAKDNFKEVSGSTPEYISLNAKQFRELKKEPKYKALKSVNKKSKEVYGMKIIIEDSDIGWHVFNETKLINEITEAK